MNALYCKNCQDLYTLKFTEYKSCTCGYTSGIIEEGKVKFRGDPMFVDIDDKTFEKAVSDHLYSNSTTSHGFSGQILGKPSPDFIEDGTNY